MFRGDRTCARLSRPILPCRRTADFAGAVLAREDFFADAIVNVERLVVDVEEREALEMLYVHLGFSMPAAVLLFVMLFTGLKHHRKLHIAAGILFSVLWTGTFITGIFFLPHE